MATRKLQVEIIGDASSLQRAFGQVDKSSSRLGATFAKVGKAAALAGVALGGAVALGAVKAVNAASNLEEQMNKTAVVFGKNGEAVQKWSEDLASSFGISQRAALEAAGTFGNMLVPMGFSRKEAAKMSQQFVELAADMASFNNASPQETLDALRAGLAGETEPLRRFGVFLNDARIKSEAAAMGFKLVKNQLDPMAKAAATASIIMKDTADTQGDFSRTSESLANQQRILKAELENSAAAIGQALLPAATALATLLAQIIPVVTEWGIRLSEAVGPVVLSAIQALVPTFENVKAAIVGVVDSLRQMIPLFQQIGTFGISVAMSSFGQATAGATLAMVAFHAGATRVIERLVALRTAAAGLSLAQAFTSLLSPVNLATLAIGFLAAGFVLSRQHAINAANAYRDVADSLTELRNASEATVASEDRLRDAKIGVKAASLAVSQALSARNKLEQEGKRGTEAFTAAQIAVQQAYSQRIRATHEVKAAENAGQQQTQKNADAVGNLNTKALALSESARKASSGLKQMGDENQRHDLANRYANAMDRLSEKAQRVAAATRDSNPQLSQAATNFSKNAAAIADYTRKAGEIPQILGRLTGEVSIAGQNVGSSFGTGVARGIALSSPGVQAAARQVVADAESAARAQAQAKSPSKLFAALGEDLTKGLTEGMGGQPVEMSGIAMIDAILRGWNAAIPKLKSELVSKVNDAITNMIQAVQNRQGAFASAFDSLVSNALSAFDKLTSEFETKTERLIRKQDEARAAADRRRALGEAQKQLTEATAGGDPEAIKAAEQALADAKFAIQRAQDEREAAAERKQYEQKRERQRVNLETQLQRLQQNYLQQEISTQQFHNNLIAIFKKFEVPLGKQAHRLGAALAKGLNDSFADVQRAARALASEILRVFEGIKVIVDVTLHGTAAPNRQHGGPVKARRAYVVGEVGPELFIPNSSGRIVANGATGTAFGGGGVTIVNYFNGDVTGEEIVQKVREGLLRVDLYNPGSAIARA